MFLDYTHVSCIINKQISFHIVFLLYIMSIRGFVPSHIRWGVTRKLWSRPEKSASGLNVQLQMPEVHAPALPPLAGSSGRVMRVHSAAWSLQAGTNWVVHHWSAGTHVPLHSFHIFLDPIHFPTISVLFSRMKFPDCPRTFPAKWTYPYTGMSAMNEHVPLEVELLGSFKKVSSHAPLTWLWRIATIIHQIVGHINYF